MIDTLFADITLVFETWPVIWYLTIAVLGLTVGSFLNVVIYRLPVIMEREFKEAYLSHFHPEQMQQAEKQPRFNLAVPGSTCPKCGHHIKAWENIPVISWLWLKAKCSQCQTAISIRYPAVEFATAALSLLIAFHFGITLQTAAALILLWSLIALTFIDIDKMLLPDQITLPLMWLGLLLSLTNVFVTPLDAILGAALGYLSLWSLYWAFKLLTGKEGMGYGDFKLLAALGAWTGYGHLPVIIIMSSFVGAILGIAMIMFNGKKQGQAIPFGPYLAIAGLITLLYGEQIVMLYWQYILA